MAEESSFLNPLKVARAAGIHEGMQVADFGAGSGFFTRAALRLVGQGGVVWAVDIHRDILPHIKSVALAEGLTNVEVVYGDVEVAGGSNLPAEYFDTVIVANLLFATEHKRELAAEAYRVLKQGGRALLVDWAGSFGGLGPHPGHVVSAAQAQKLFETQGFASPTQVYAGEYHWGLLFRKTRQGRAQ